MTGRTPQTPLVVQIAEQFREDLVLLEDAQAMLMAQRWLEVEGALQGRIEALAQAAYDEFGEGAELSEAQFFRLARYQALLAQTQDELARYIDDAVAIIDDNAEGLVRRGVQDAQTLIQATGQQHGQFVQMTFMRINTSAVEHVTAIARAGQPLHDLMSLAYGNAADGMLRELTTGIALGQNPRETARRMRQDGLSRGYSHTELVARDIHNRTYRAATREQYLASTVVEGYIRLAAKNDRTCLACLALDGAIYATNEFMELHPQDRCTMVPNVRGLPRPAFPVARDWFAQQDAATQRRIMGPGRYEAYQAGRFTWAQLVSKRDNEVWGPSAMVTPLSDLLRGKGGVDRPRI